MASRASLIHRPHQRACLCPRERPWPPSPSHPRRRIPSRPSASPARPWTTRHATRVPRPPHRVVVARLPFLSASQLPQRHRGVRGWPPVNPGPPPGRCVCSSRSADPLLASTLLHPSPVLAASSAVCPVFMLHAHSHTPGYTGRTPAS